MKFQKHNLHNIKGIISDETGVSFESRRISFFSVRRMVAVAALIGMLAVTAAATELFSSLSGDELSFSSNYQENGIVKIEVENKSSKQISFEEKVKVMQFYENKEIEPHGEVLFSGTKIAPNSKGTLQIDLSEAYDIKELEKEIPNDWYYLVLTNNNFMFGQDWMCTVEFSPVHPDEPNYPLPETNTSEPLNISFDSLKPYFKRAQEEIIWGQPDRLQFIASYYEEAEKALSQVDERIVPASDIHETGIQLKEDFLTLDPVNDYYIPKEGYLMSSHKVSGVDGFFIPVGRKDEKALVIEALLPQKADDINSGGTGIPLAYFMAYKSDEVQKENSCAFIRGQLVSFSDMSDFEAYRDENYIIYNVTGLFYTDLESYIKPVCNRTGAAYPSDAVLFRLKNNSAYYESLSPDSFSKIN